MYLSSGVFEGSLSTTPSAVPRGTSPPASFQDKLLSTGPSFADRLMRLFGGGNNASTTTSGEKSNSYILPVALLGVAAITILILRK